MKRIFKLLMVLFVVLVSCEDSERSKEEYEVWLEETYDELVMISESVECTNPDEWVIVAIGQNICGDPMYYLPVHESVNTIIFQKKVEGYTNTSIRYVEKWHSNTACSQELRPNVVGIECADGKSVLIYE